MSYELSALVEQCLAGDQSAARKFIDLFRGRVYGLCMRMVKEHHDAEDMAQETFVRVFRHLDRWDRERPIEPWILTIAGNRCRTLLSQRKRRPIAQPVEDYVADSRPDMGPANQLAEELHLALDKIRAEYRQAFLMFHERELSYAEIAEELQCPLGTVKTWVYRARRLIVDQLTKRGVVEGYGNEVQRI